MNNYANSRWKERGSFSKDTLHSYQDIVDAIRTAPYGIDTREAMAQMMMFLYSTVQSIGDSFNIDMSPTDTFENVAKLKEKYPNGQQGVFVVQDTGHWYFWSELDEVWKDGGTYQSAGLPVTKLYAERFAITNGLPINVQINSNGIATVNFNNSNILCYLGSEPYGITNADLMNVLRSSNLVTVDDDGLVTGNDWALIFRRNLDNPFVIVKATGEDVTYSDFILVSVKGNRFSGALVDDMNNQKLLKLKSDMSSADILGDYTSNRILQSKVDIMPSGNFGHINKCVNLYDFTTLESSKTDFGLFYKVDDFEFPEEKLILSFAINGKGQVEILTSDTTDGQGTALDTISPDRFNSANLFYEKLVIKKSSLKNYIIVKFKSSGNYSVANMNLSENATKENLSALEETNVNGVKRVPINSKTITNFARQSDLVFQNGTVYNRNNGAVNLILGNYILPINRNVYIEITCKLFVDKSELWLNLKDTTGNIVGASSIDNVHNSNTIQLVVTPEFWSKFENRVNLNIVLNHVAAISEIKVSHDNFFKNKFEYGGVPKAISDDTTTVQGLSLIGEQTTFKTDGYIESVTAKVDIEGAYTFKVGNLDQNQLLVNAREFTANLLPGVSTYKLQTPVKVSESDMLFMVPKSEKVYNMNGGNPNALLQDNSHPTNNPGYAGQTLYSSNYQVPFSAKVKYFDKQFKNEINSRIDEIANKSENKFVKIASPSGKTFILSVDDSGNLSAISAVPNKVAVFGNSLTKHPDFQGWGMEANYGKDYYSLLKSYTESQNPSVQFIKGGIGVWESKTTIQDHTTESQNIANQIDSDTGLVILQLGDNVNDNYRKQDLTTNVVNLIKKVKAKAPQALIYVIACWFNAGNVPAIKLACEQTGAEFVDISDLYVRENYGAIGETRRLADGSIYTITDQGVAIHPNDQGFAKIFDKIKSKLMY
ncbi:SGNH/GDSL hydrolase family protein [Ligilactobacillus salivarius]|uniref:SGNH/GDSL hydrolase family protein n=1 Tax=Ligilactobacillus salivarius TaxID=1624 RepID=UPI0020234500|nr:SGNH/GDSL hydrolase family protein [Ligilactobacillus salivarius]URI13475.1 SGNH/GDSL hydrolase family protein [Ligilactobacillus salivarius]UUB35313.1 SGNH/GDSL hydrolase family protein [Ligilactobacillus salivarius]